MNLIVFFLSILGLGVVALAILAGYIAIQAFTKKVTFITALADFEGRVRLWLSKLFS